MAQDDRGNITGCARLLPTTSPYLLYDTSKPDGTPRKLLDVSRLLLSEDLQHGFTWRGVTVVDRFIAPHAPLLASVLSIDRQEK